MDTVEWGTGEPNGRRGGRFRSTAMATSGRGAAGVFALLGLATLIAAEVLPWGMLHIAGSSSGSGRSSRGTFGIVPPDLPASASELGLDKLDSGSAFVYRLGTLLLLAVVGAALLGRPAQRRTAVGIGLGVVAAQALVVVSMVHSLSTVNPMGNSTLLLDLAGSPTVFSSSVESGAFCAFASLALLLAALLLAALPDQVRLKLIGGPQASPGVPAGGEPLDLTVGPAEAAPLDLTVGPAAPLDEAYYSRPDGYGR